MLCLASEELLLCQTPLTRALWTSENHLRATRLSALQMCLCDVCERLDKDRAIVQALDALNTLMALCVLTNDLLVQFV